MKLRQALFVWTSLMLAACAHTVVSLPADVKAGVAGPDTYEFPKLFFVEQYLIFQTPDGVKNMVGQLQRQGDKADLVLTDGTSSLVLARLALQRGQAPELVFLAPLLKGKDFPAPEIGAAVQALIESPALHREPDGYHLPDQKNHRWAYSWQDFIPGDGCLFPRVLDLAFLDPRYHLTIAARNLDCGATP